jgi:hypothetical protein
MNPLSAQVTLLLLITGFLSCKTSPTDFATEWTNDIKQKIIIDANQPYDRTEFDSIYYKLTLFKGDRKLKHFVFRPKFDTTNGKVLFLDTVVSIFYSADQRFELVRELCPAINRSFEGVNFKGIGSVGLTEFRYCDGKIKESGYRYGYKAVGVWTKYDSIGNIFESKDNGNVDFLNKLHDINYHR